MRQLGFDAYVCNEDEYIIHAIATVLYLDAQKTLNAAMIVAKLLRRELVTLMLDED